MTIKAIADATPEEARFLEQAAHRISTNKKVTDCSHYGGFESLWEAWDRIDVLWLSRDGLSVIFTYDDSFSIAVIRVSDCFENTIKGSEEVPQERFAGCFTELADYALKMRQNRSRHVVINVDPWISDRYEIARLGHSGRHRLAVARKTDRLLFPRGVTTYLDVGMVKRVDEDVQEEAWRPRIPFTVRADGDVFRVTHGPFGFMMLNAAEETIRFRSEDHGLPKVMYARWKKLYRTTGRLERLLVRELSHQFEDLLMTRDERQVVLPTIDGIPRRRRDIEFYEKEWEDLHTVFSSVLTRCGHAARCIQRQWRRSICDPNYKIARTRLIREYMGLVQE